MVNALRTTVSVLIGLISGIIVAFFLLPDMNLLWKILFSIIVAGALQIVAQWNYSYDNNDTPIVNLILAFIVAGLTTIPVNLILAEQAQTLSENFI